MTGSTFSPSHQKNITSTVGWLVGALLLMLLLGACAGSGQPAEEQEATSTPIPTAPAVAKPTWTVQRGTVQDVLEFTGRWMPRDQMSLAFEVAGTVRRVEVRRGDTVEAGQLLADLQITDLENNLASAQLDLESAIASLESGDEGTVQSVTDAEVSLANARLSLENQKASSPWTSVESARINLEKAQDDLDNAQRNYDDAVSHPDSAASATDGAYEQLQNARVSLQNAQNSYYSAAQSFNNHKFAVAQAENAVIQAELNLQRALEGGGADTSSVRGVQLRIDQINASIAQSSLYAPIDGVVLEVTIQPGDSVQAYDAVITIGIPEPKEAIANLAFNDAQRLSVGMVGICQIINRPETAVQCAVRQIPLTARDADQTTRVAASLDDVADGQLVEVQMPLQVRENVLWLPEEAIRTFQNRTFVVLETADGPRTVNVELGLRTEDRVEIESGVNEGDVVIGP